MNSDKKTIFNRIFKKPLIAHDSFFYVLLVTFLLIMKIYFFLEFLDAIPRPASLFICLLMTSWLINEIYKIIYKDE